MNFIIDCLSLLHHKYVSKKIAVGSRTCLEYPSDGEHWTRLSDPLSPMRLSSREILRSYGGWVWRIMCIRRRVKIWLMQPRTGRNPFCLLMVLLLRTDVKWRSSVEGETLLTIDNKLTSQWSLRSSGFPSWRLAQSVTPTATMEYAPRSKHHGASS